MKLQITLSGPAERLLKNMQEQLDTSQKNVILDALALYHTAMTEIRENRNRFGSYDPNSREFTAFTTPLLSSLDHLKEKEKTFQTVAR